MFEKILDKLGLGDIEDEYDDEEMEYGDDDEYYDEPEVKRSSRNSYDDEDELPRSSKLSQRSKNNNVVPMSNKAVHGLEVCVIHPQSIEDGREITETLRSGKIVVLNVEGVRIEITQRIIDYSVGTSIALNGNFQKVSNTIFIISPKNVSISGNTAAELIISGDVGFGSPSPSASHPAPDKVTSHRLDY